MDDCFASHPKMLAVGPLGLAIQVRALCYAAHHKTDGFLPLNVLPLLLAGIVEAESVGWPTQMVEQGLWEQVRGGYQIHDYLHWNMSKREQENWKRKLSHAGKRGMKRRWDKASQPITKVITKVITNPVTSPSTSTSNVDASSPDPSLSEESHSPPSLHPNRSKKEKTSRSEPVSANGKSGATWLAYATAYEVRYHAVPVRNAKVNAMLATLVDRLGIEEAPLVAAFYLTHNRALYVQARHPTNLLLRDAEGLRTEWATGVKATGCEAKNAEAQDAVVEQIKRVRKYMEEGRNGSP